MVRRGPWINAGSSRRTSTVVSARFSWAPPRWPSRGGCPTGGLGLGQAGVDLALARLHPRHACLERVSPLRLAGGDQLGLTRLHLGQARVELALRLLHA